MAQVWCTQHIVSVMSDYFLASVSQGVFNGVVPTLLSCDSVGHKSDQIHVGSGVGRTRGEVRGPCYPG